jgi:prolipoprotein diacylglyceryltransferase
MYPGLTDILNDFFGTHFTSSFPPTFGTLVAISFLLGAWTLGIELKRREKDGIFQPEIQEIKTGEPASFGEIFWNGLFGFLLGFKIVYILLNHHDFFSDPQKTILSLKGNWPAGLLMGGLFAWQKYREKEKLKLPETKTSQVAVYPHQLVSEITMAAALGGLLGAKIFHLLEYWDDFIADPFGMFFSGSGLTMYGGLIVGAIAVLWYGKKNKIPPLHMCDANAPGLMLAYGTGRLGCQLAGDGDWGIVNNLPKPSILNFLPDWIWSYRYPHNVISEGIPIEGCSGHHCYQLAEGVFPTPFYESITCIALFFVLWRMRKNIRIPGLLFSWYLFFNGIERFLVETIRVNSKYHLAGIEFSQAQLISSLLIIIGTAGIIYFKKKETRYAAVS